MELNIENKSTYVNQTATADIEGRHYDIDYQVHYQSGSAELIYLNATFGYGTAEVLEEGKGEAGGSGLATSSTTKYNATLTWGQGMLQLPRAIDWDPSLWQNVKDFSEIVNSVQNTVSESVSISI